jgi:hypothetical protein
MGFGAVQAFLAGVPHRNPRSVAQIYKLMRERSALKEVRGWVERYPELVPIAIELLEARKVTNSKACSAQELLELLYPHIRDLRRKALRRVRKKFSIATID